MQKYNIYPQGQTRSEQKNAKGVNLWHLKSYSISSVIMKTFSVIALFKKKSATKLPHRSNTRKLLHLLILDLL